MMALTDMSHREWGNQPRARVAAYRKIPAALRARKDGTFSLLRAETGTSAVLRRMGRGELTAHGFRSTFRDWAAEATGHPNHVVEATLAHAISEKVENGGSRRTPRRPGNC